MIRIDSEFVIDIGSLILEIVNSFVSFLNEFFVKIGCRFRVIPLE